MKFLFAAALGLVVVASATLGAGQTQTQTRPAPAPAVRPVRSSAAPAPDAGFLSKYCITCHNPRAKTGGLSLEAEGVGARRLRRGGVGESGPQAAHGHDAAERHAPARCGHHRGVHSALEARLDQANPPGRHPETPTFQRLNRTEYANAIRDLLAIDVDARALLPGDDASEGFDNIAEALTVSPSLVQGYVAAALKISRQAIGDRTVAPSQITYSAPGEWVHDKHVEGLPLGTRGGLLISHTFPLDAEYELSIGGGGGGGGFVGSGLDVTLDGEQLKVANPRSFRQRITAGPHTIGLALVDRQRGAGVDDTFSDHRNDAKFATAGGVQTLTILGPFERHRHQRHAEPRAHPGVPAGHSRRGAWLRAADRVEPGAARLPAAPRGRGDRHADDLLPSGAGGGELRGGPPARAGAHPGGACVPAPHGGTARRHGTGLACTPSAISRWRRVSPSSSGAASPTTSCWISRSPAG